MTKKKLTMLEMVAEQKLLMQKHPDLKVMRPVVEKARVLENNVLTYVDIERSRTFNVSLGDITKEEAKELGVMTDWKEFKKLELMKEGQALEEDVEVVEAPKQEPVMDSKSINKHLQSKRPVRGAALKGDAPKSSDPETKSVAAVSGKK